MEGGGFAYTFKSLWETEQIKQIFLLIMQQIAGFGEVEETQRLLQQLRGEAALIQLFLLDQPIPDPYIVNLEAIPHRQNAVFSVAAHAVQVEEAVQIPLFARGLPLQISVGKLLLRSLLRVEQEDASVLQQCAGEQLFPGLQAGGADHMLCIPQIKQAILLFLQEVQIFPAVGGDFAVDGAAVLCFFQLQQGMD